MIFRKLLDKQLVIFCKVLDNVPKWKQLSITIRKKMFFSETDSPAYGYLKDN